MTLYQSSIPTLLGDMIAICDQKNLYLLEFIDRKNLSWEIKRLQQKYIITLGRTHIIESIEKELNAYFNGTLKMFKTPYTLIGTTFQQNIWRALTTIDYGKTQSYGELANTINKPKAFRAAALANSVNQLCIIIPCHRVINSDGKLAGYGAGVERKQWLLEHERKHQ